MSVVIFGIKNCDTMKKARAWLDGKGIAYVFCDYKTGGVELGRLEGWSKKVGWESLINRSGTTFRKLPEPEKECLSEASALALMIANPSMIRRPVLEIGDQIVVGFNPDRYGQLLSVR